MRVPPVRHNSVKANKKRNFNNMHKIEDLEARCNSIRK